MTRFLDWLDESALARYFAHGHETWLAPIGGDVPDWFADIELARHCNIAPDWFAQRHPVWRDWAIIHLNVTREVERTQAEMARNHRG